jgi:hypothetical protein
MGEMQIVCKIGLDDAFINLNARALAAAADCAAFADARSRLAYY